MRRKTERTRKRWANRGRSVLFVGQFGVFSQLNANLNASDSLHSNINRRRPLSSRSQILSFFLNFFYFI